MSSVIKQRNHKVLSTIKNVDRLCNIRNKDNCPPDGKSLCRHVSFTRLMSSRIRTIKSTLVLVIENLNLDTITTYVHFAIDITNKKHNFLKHIWKRQDKGINFTVKWSVAAYTLTYRCGSRRCHLCLTEKYLIARANHKNLLNKRTELISKCCHRNTYIFKNIKTQLNRIENYTTKSFICSNGILSELINLCLTSHIM